MQTEFQKDQLLLVWNLIEGWETDGGGGESQFQCSWTIRVLQYHPDKIDDIYQSGLFASKAWGFVVTAIFHLEICEEHFIFTNARKKFKLRVFFKQIIM